MLTSFWKFTFWHFEDLNAKTFSLFMGACIDWDSLKFKYEFNERQSGPNLHQKMVSKPLSILQQREGRGIVGVSPVRLIFRLENKKIHLSVP